MTLYERIRQLRIQAGMSQDDLAHAMGYKDRSMITKIESGKVDISQKKIIAFANVLNTTPAYLMGWTDSKEPVEEMKLDLFSSDSSPHTPEAQILAKGVDKLPKAQREQALNIIRAVFTQYADYCEKEK